MKILAMETSTQLGSVAIIIDGHVVAEEVSFKQKSHSENISPFIEECLKMRELTLNDMDAFAVGAGPGSFTGIRVAANAGKTFSYCYNKPLVAVDSLVLLAEQARGCERPVLSIINAYKNMVYMGLFDVSGEYPAYLRGPDAVPVRELSKFITQEVLVVGDGWNAYHPYFPDDLKFKCIRNEETSEFPQARTLGLLAERQLLKGHTNDWKSFTPLYIRASEAEETKKGILITPLTY